jgi:hypothetical protein
MKTKQPSEQADLDRKEWCFKSIRPSETDACYLYEYCRELARRPQRILETPERYGSVEAVEEFRKVMTHWLFCNPALLNDCDPNISWQELDQRTRSALVEIQTNLRSASSLIMDLERELVDVTTIKRFRHGLGSWQDELDLQRTEYGFFAINWRYADREIKRRFEQWLSEQREEVKWTEIDYKAKARGGSLDRLNWLGALRVKKHYRKTQLVDYADTNLKVDAPYSHLPDLYKNAKRAGNLLKILSQIFGRS